MERKSGAEPRQRLAPPSLHAAPDAVMIDWSGTVVKLKGRDLELAVRLSTAPDSVWKNEFARIST